MFLQKTLTILTFLLLLISCSSNEKPKKSVSQEENPPEITFGALMHYTLTQSSCHTDFYYYIPDDSVHVPKPPVFFFDPHARGKDAIESYVTIADSLHIMLIGSNQLKNGMDYTHIHSILQCTWKTVIQNLPVDTSKIIFAGFSGGGRIALEEGVIFTNVCGIISCGAAHIPSKIHHHAPYIFIAGNEDFNYLECRETVMQFPVKQNVLFLPFEGKHEWPPKDKLAKAITACLNHNLPVQTMEYTKEEKDIFREEALQREVITRNFGTKNLEWWHDYYDQLTQKADQSNTQKALSAKRILNYISMVAYMHTDKALKTKNMKYVEYSLTIYRLVDPQNPDLHFFNACYNSLNNHPDKALADLDTAIKLGFSDKEKLVSTSSLYAIRQDQRYWDIVKAIEK